MSHRPRLPIAAGLAVLLAGTGLISQALSQSGEEPGAGRSIRMAQPNDETGWIMTEVYSQLLEELGYDVSEPVTLNIPVAFESLSGGGVDLYVDGWFPLANTFMEGPDYGAETVGYVIRRGALQGYLVDKASAEKYDITSLDDFKREEVREAFDRDGDGKADMVACPPGWGCEAVIQHHMDAFDLRDAINPVKANYTASMADAIAAFEGGEPILFYTWTPNWTVNELKPGEDVVWIQTPNVDLPEDQAAFADTATVDGVEGCVADPCRLGWPVNDIRSVANSAFLEENPAVRTLLEEASLPVEFVFRQNAEMQKGDDDLERQAAEWIEANRDRVDEWLAAARQSAEG